jgi:hypothetical protein
MTHDRTGEIGKLLALARKRQGDEFVETFDKINEDDNKIRERVIRGPADTKQTVEVDVSALYTPGVSTTASVDILRTEAALYADGELGPNPHIPASESVMAEAREAIEADGLTPAWEVFAADA